jgi:hypothetical protein
LLCTYGVEQEAVEDLTQVDQVVLVPLDIM